MATCPECDAEIEIDPDDLEELEIGDPWDCDACGSSLRVVSLDPLDFESDEEEDEDEDAKPGAEGEEEEVPELDEDFEEDNEDDEKEDWDE